VCNPQPNCPGVDRGDNEISDFTAGMDASGSLTREGDVETLIY